MLKLGNQKINKGAQNIFQKAEPGKYGSLFAKDEKKENTGR